MNEIVYKISEFARNGDVKEGISFPIEMYIEEYGEQFKTKSHNANVRVWLGWLIETGSTEEKQCAIELMKGLIRYNLSLSQQ